MSVVEKRTWTPTDADREPARAHFAWADDPTVAVCWARLLGVRAPESHPECADCLRIRERFRGIRRFWGES